MHTADQIGALRAQIAALTDQLKPLEAELKAQGAGVHEGELYRCTVVESHPTRINWQKIAAKLNPSRQLIQAHSKTSTTLSVRCTARLKSAA